MKTKTYILLFIFLSFTIVQAQKIKTKTKEGEVDKTNTFLAAPPPVYTIDFKDDVGNSLITITDEGTNGSITIPSGSFPTTTTNKLYSNGGALFFGNVKLTTTGATSINGLSDAIYDGSSLFLGSGAGSNDDGTTNKNTAVGLNALNHNITGSENTAHGYEALFWNSGSENTAIGINALFNNTNGDNNVGVGARANFYNQGGSNNTMIGFRAGEGPSAHTKSGSIFIGYQAGLNETGSNLLYIENSSSSLPLLWGDFANDSVEINGDLHVTGSFNVGGASNLFLGSGAGENNSTGDYNTVAGYNALNSNTDGGYNTALGYHALKNNLTGSYNTATGYRALRSNTGNGNTSNGFDALLLNTSGTENTAIGYLSLLSNTVGDSNVAIGSAALYYNTTGGSNVVIGNRANLYGEGGSNNTIIGNLAGHGGQGGNIKDNKTGNVFLGYMAGYNEVSNNKLYIENSGSNSPLIWGDFSANRVVINGNASSNGSNRTFFVNGQAGGTTAWFNDSDIRLKKNIKTIPDALRKVNKLRGVNYEWKDPENYDEGLQIGFIAQEVEKVIPEVVDTSGEYYSMQYAPVTALLVEAVKELSKQNKELSNRVEKLEQKLREEKFSNASE